MAASIGSLGQHVKFDKEKASIQIGVGTKLTLNDAKLLALKPIPVTLSSATFNVMESSFDFLRSCVDKNMSIYGVNTNFGDQVNFVDTKPSNESITERQVNIIRSLSCSLGPITPPEIIRNTMMLRAHCLSQGFSGISHEVISTMLDFLNAGVLPVVRQYGSIGASGDLIPLASIAAVLIGEDVEVMYQDKILRAPEAITLAGLKPLSPQLRDGLALINGTSFMTAISSISLYNLRRLFNQMLAAIAMALESMQAISSSYNPLVHQLKGHSGEIAVNNFMLNFWEGSQLLSDLNLLRAESLKPENIEKMKRMQDYYSLRSVPQGFGPFYENLDKAVIWTENEMNSINDNPIIDTENEEVYHSANFMGYYITDVCDILKMNISQASMWMHALLANLVHPRKNFNLPANLVENPGKNNGFRSLQLLAAAIAVQNRKLAQSQQAYTLPTEGDNQDVNSLGTHAAFDLREATFNLERLTAITLLAATQALELRGVKKASRRSQEIFDVIRSVSPTVLNCRPMADELHNVIKLLEDEKI